MPTMKRPPLSQECIEAWIVLRVAQLRELAAWTAREYWRQRKGGDTAAAEWQLDAAVHNLRKLHRNYVHRAKNQGNGGRRPGRWPDPSHVAGASYRFQRRASPSSASPWIQRQPLNSRLRIWGSGVRISSGAPNKPINQFFPQRDLAKRSWVWFMSEQCPRRRAASTRFSSKVSHDSRSG